MANVLFITDFSESYARDMMLGIAKYAREKEQTWSLSRLSVSVREQYGVAAVVDWAKQIHADAVIGQFDNDDDVELFALNGIIAIAQDYKSRFKSIINITGDYADNGRIAAEYFIKKGFKHFGFYGMSDAVWSLEREESFCNTLKKHGHEVSVLHQIETDNMWHYNHLHVSSWLSSLAKPCAIMACDDNHAYHIIESCQLDIIHHFRIPTDIAVLGVDNDEAVCALSNPPLTSLGQDIEKGGYEVARLIDQMLAHPKASYKDIIVRSTQIYTRKSTDIYVNEDPIISDVLKVIHENINSKISVDDLVDLVPLSRRLLENRFKQSVGSTIYEYITKERIEKACQLLREIDSISAVASELGIYDLKNFSRTFKRVMGVTPSEYQKQTRG